MLVDFEVVSDCSRIDFKLIKSNDITVVILSSQKVLKYLRLNLYPKGYYLLTLDGFSWFERLSER